MRQPRILLLDEPTSALDLQRQVEVLELLRGLARSRGICVLVALHDLNQALRFADQVAVLSGGRVVASGSPAAVLSPDLLQSGVRVEARLERCSQGLPFLTVDGSVRPVALRGASARPVTPQTPVSGFPGAAKHGIAAAL